MRPPPNENRRALPRHRAALSGPALAVLLALAPGLSAQESPCDAIDELAGQWDEVATALDEALGAGLTDADVEELEARIEEHLGPTWELAELLVDEAEGGAAELGAQLQEDLGFLEESPDYETTLEDIDYVIETLDLIVGLCDESADGDEPRAGAVVAAATSLGNASPAPTRRQRASSRAARSASRAATSARACSAPPEDPRARARSERISMRNPTWSSTESNSRAEAARSRAAR